MYSNVKLGTKAAFSSTVFSRMVDLKNNNLLLIFFPF